VYPHHRGGGAAPPSVHLIVYHHSPISSAYPRSFDVFLHPAGRLPSQRARAGPPEGQGVKGAGRPLVLTYQLSVLSSLLLVLLHMNLLPAAEFSALDTVFAGNGLPQDCPGCGVPTRNTDGSQARDDVAMARQRCTELWCVPCLAGGIIEAVRTPGGVFKCPKCGVPLISYDTRRREVPPAEAGSAVRRVGKQARVFSAAAGPKNLALLYKTTTTRLGDPKRVLPATSVREYMMLPLSLQDERCVISVTSSTRDGTGQVYTWGAGFGGSGADLDPSSQRQVLRLLGQELRRTVLLAEMGDFGEGVGGDAPNVSVESLREAAGSDTSLMGTLLRALCSGDDRLPADFENSSIPHTVEFRKNLCGAWACREILRGRQVPVGQHRVGKMQAHFAWGVGLGDNGPLCANLREFGMSRCTLFGNSTH